MEILLGIEGGTILALAVALIRVSYMAGLMKQRLEDLSTEVARMRDRLDRFIDPYKYHDRDGC